MNQVGATIGFPAEEGQAQGRRKGREDDQKEGWRKGEGRGSKTTQICSSEKLKLRTDEFSDEPPDG